jgi:hypothetical protein
MIHWHMWSSILAILFVYFAIVSHISNNMHVVYKIHATLHCTNWYWRVWNIFGITRSWHIDDGCQFLLFAYLILSATMIYVLWTELSLSISTAGGTFDQPNTEPQPLIVPVNSLIRFEERPNLSVSTSPEDVDPLVLPNPTPVLLPSSSPCPDVTETPMEPMDKRLTCPFYSINNLMIMMHGYRTLMFI